MQGERPGSRSDVVGPDVTYYDHVSECLDEVLLPKTGLTPGQVAVILAKEEFKSVMTQEQMTLSECAECCQVPEARGALETVKRGWGAK